MSSMTADDVDVNVGKGIHLYRPTEPDHINPSHPTVVLIFGWMAAKFSHLQKYTSIYRERYPNTTLALTQCEPSFFWSNQHAQHQALAPLVDGRSSWIDSSFTRSLEKLQNAIGLDCFPPNTSNSASRIQQRRSLPANDPRQHHL